jgi:hypothetical protein
VEEVRPFFSPVEFELGRADWIVCGDSRALAVLVHCYRSSAVFGSTPSDVCSGTPVYRSLWVIVRTEDNSNAGVKHVQWEPV